MRTLILISALLATGCSVAGDVQVAGMTEAQLTEHLGAKACAVRDVAPGVQVLDYCGTVERGVAYWIDACAPKCECGVSFGVADGTVFGARWTPCGQGGAAGGNVLVVMP